MHLLSSFLYLKEWKSRKAKKSHEIRKKKKQQQEKKKVMVESWRLGRCPQTDSLYDLPKRSSRVNVCLAAGSKRTEKAPTPILWWQSPWGDETFSWLAALIWAGGGSMKNFHRRFNNSKKKKKKERPFSSFFLLLPKSPTSSFKWPCMPRIVPHRRLRNPNMWTQTCHRKPRFSKPISNRSMLTCGKTINFFFFMHTDNSSDSHHKPQRHQIY